ncbi:AmmeMemoRadiSam system protein B [Roseospira visakhapatnamensis]|uniref:AMMECR1 domain-containing protein n=1 Tax=Roseospira visakhapatnamensis TaxID=390880 RepID=A0A7W6RAI6_9PROT|nr:AmmeMemoRadiSam system protein B [Roseospira visakhapatnamensis]MBB4264939.1 hypothetical protein [Roseospira visakhapatnamensis]
MTAVRSPRTPSVRAPAIAGTFYAADPDALRRSVRADLDRARARRPADAPVPKAIIAPHAGHVYSGALAARAYVLLEPARNRIRRVLLVGPSHRVAFEGVALSGADRWRTPLGEVPLDHAWTRDRLGDDTAVSVLDHAHAQEHCLEVHLPYLQEALGDIALVPLVAGRVASPTLARVLDALWNGPETAIVISSDLSHFLDYDACQARDGATASAIEALRPGVIGPRDACGCRPVDGLLTLARRRGLRVERIGLCNSGDTAGTRDRVVGYGAWAFHEPEGTATDSDPVEATARLARAHTDLLVGLAKEGVDHAVRDGTPPRVPVESLPQALRAHGAAFVTLTRADGGLRGCIGSLEARRPLAQDVAGHAFNAACRDARFPPVTADELPGLTVSISVLTPPMPLPFADRDDLLQAMRPGVDGLILEDRGRRGVFLPQVWEQVPEPEVFLAHLLRKAGLADSHWSDDVRLWRFETRGVKAAPWSPAAAPASPSGPQNP